MSKEKKPGTGASNKRRKELAAAKLERQCARRAPSGQARHKRRVRIGWSVAALVGVLAVAAVVLWPDSGSDTVAEPAASASAAPSASADASAAPTASPSPVAVEGCGPAPTPPSDPQSWDEAPAMQLEDGTEYQMILATNCGEIVIDTFADKAPETVNAMLWLAGEEYFDSTLCHRLVTEGIFVLQCGDPTATGTGGPGFELPDENLPTAEGVTTPRAPWRWPTPARARPGASSSSSTRTPRCRRTTRSGAR